MAFTVADYQDLLQLLREHPEWQAPLRDLLVGEQFARLGASIDRLEAAVADNSRLIAELREATAENSRQIAELREATAENGRQIAELRQTTAENARRVEELTVLSRVHEESNRTQLGELQGWAVERRLRENGRSLLAQVVRRATVVSVADLEEVDRGLDDGRLTDGELADLAHIDLLMQGTRRLDGSDVVLAIEVSKTIAMSDLDRADRRAAILKRVGYRAVPMVAGDVIRPEDHARAEERGIAVMIRGTIENWPTAA